MAPSVHHMADRFMHSREAAAELAQATLAKAKSDLEAGAVETALDAHLFRIMHEIVLQRLGLR